MSAPLAVSAPMPRPPERRWASLAVSALLHAAILAVLLFLHIAPRQQENWLPPPTFDVIYDNGGSKESPAVPNQAPPDRNLPPSPPAEPQASSPAVPPLPVPPVQQPPSEQAQVPAPAAPAPSVAAPASPKAAPAPVEPPSPSPQAQAEAELPKPTPAPQPSEAPSQGSAQPEAAPEAKAPPMETAIQLVPPAFPTPPLVLPPLPPPPRPAPHPRPAPAFPTPMAYSLGGRQASPAQRRSLDLAFAPLGRGADRFQPLARSDDPNVGADWLNLVAAWWRRHAYYPPQAGMNGEQGDVTVGLVVRRDGKVTALRLENRSGSPWLDMASMAIFRDAQLPPLPPEVTSAEIPLHFTIHYVIIH